MTRRSHRMRRLGTGLALGLCGIAGLPSSAFAWQGVAAEAVDLSGYQSFLNNWDEAAQPVFCAVLRSQADWDGVFSPAAVMGDERPFAPPEAFWQDKALVVAGVVVPMGEEAAFANAEVTGSKGDLRVSWTRPAAPAASADAAMMKAALALAVPREVAAGRAVFVENGAVACEAGA